MGGHLAVLAQLSFRTYETTNTSSPPGWFFGGFFLLWAVVMVVSLAGYVFGIWSLVEIIRYREDEFTAVGLNRTTWLVLQIVGLAVCQPMGAVVGIIFVWKKRPVLRSWREAHPGAPVVYVPYMAYGPPPGYPPPPGQGPPPGYGPALGHPAAPGYPPPVPPAAPGYPPPVPPAAPDEIAPPGSTA